MAAFFGGDDGGGEAGGQVKEDCAICFNALSSEPVSCMFSGRGARCPHYMHDRCLQNWIESERLKQRPTSCPTCRFQFDEKQILPDPLEDTRGFFDMLDVNGDKSLSKVEVINGLKACLEIPASVIEFVCDTAWSQWDKDASGTICFEEMTDHHKGLIGFLRRKKEEVGAAKQGKEIIPCIRTRPEEWFAHWDHDGSLTLDKAEVKRAVIKTLGSISRNPINAVDVADYLDWTWDAAMDSTPGDGHITFLEFMAANGLHAQISANLFFEEEMNPDAKGKCSINYFCSEDQEFDFKDLVHLGCEHRICTNCFVGFCESRINEARVGEQELCCQREEHGQLCRRRIGDELLVRYLNPELVTRCHRFQMKKFVEENVEVAPGLRICPKCGEYCVDVMAQDEDSPRQVAVWKSVSCLLDTCHHKFCGRCGNPPHKGQPDQDLSCADYAKWLADNEKGDQGMHELLEAGEIRQCPKCKQNCAKGEGCKFMLTHKAPNGKPCNCYFCWLCGVELTNAQHFTHFQDAPGCTGPFGLKCRGPADGVGGEGWVAGGAAVAAEAKDDDKKKEVPAKAEAKGK